MSQRFPEWPQSVLQVSRSYFPDLITVQVSDLISLCLCFVTYKILELDIS